jgi:hypothetical protein
LGGDLCERACGRGPKPETAAPRGRPALAEATDGGIRADRTTACTATTGTNPGISTDATDDAKNSRRPRRRDTGVTTGADDCITVSFQRQQAAQHQS